MRRAIAIATLLCITVLSGSHSAPAVESREGRVHSSQVRAIRGAPRQGGLIDLFAVGHPALEPTLGLTPKGNVFYAAAATNTRVEVLASGDDAETWDVVSPTMPNGQNSHLVSLDPYVHVDPETGRVFTIDLTVACSYLSFSDDEGESWTTNPFACGVPVNDHQTLFTGEPVVSPAPVYPRIVYYCSSGAVGAVCSKSLDGGLTFAATGEPAFHANTYDEDGEAACGWLHGHGTTDPSGNVYLPAYHCGHPYLAISRDEGATWERVRVADVPTALTDPAIASDSAGNLYYVWVAADRQPRLSVSKDAGRTWSRPIRVSPSGMKETNLATVAAGEDGNVGIAFMGSTTSRFDPRRCADCQINYSNVTWDGYVVGSTNATAARPAFFGGRVNPPDKPLVYGTCGPGRCNVVYDFIDVQIDSSQRAWAAFVGDERYWGDAEESTGQGLVALMDLMP